MEASVLRELLEALVLLFNYTIKTDTTLIKAISNIIVDKTISSQHIRSENQFLFRKFFIQVDSLLKAQGMNFKDQLYCSNDDKYAKLFESLKATADDCYNILLRPNLLIDKLEYIRWSQIELKEIREYVIYFLYSSFSRTNENFKLNKKLIYLALCDIDIENKTIVFNSHLLAIKMNLLLLCLEQGYFDHSDVSFWLNVIKTRIDEIDTSVVDRLTGAILSMSDIGSSVLNQLTHIFQVVLPGSKNTRIVESVIKLIEMNAKADPRLNRHIIEQLFDCVDEKVLESYWHQLSNLIISTRDSKELKALRIELLGKIAMKITKGQATWFNFVLTLSLIGDLDDGSKYEILYKLLPFFNECSSEEWLDLYFKSNKEQKQLIKLCIPFLFYCINGSKYDRNSPFISFMTIATLSLLLAENKQELATELTTSYLEQLEPPGSVEFVKLMTHKLNGDVVKCLVKDPELLNSINREAKLAKRMNRFENKTEEENKKPAKPGKLGKLTLKKPS